VAFILIKERTKKVKVNFVNLIFNLINMKSSQLYHDHLEKMEARYLDEIKKMSAQQRFDKLMAIIEISYLLKTAKKPKTK
jgi:hypothetical protein